MKICSLRLGACVLALCAILFAGCNHECDDSDLPRSTPATTDSSETAPPTVTVDSPPTEIPDGAIPVQVHVNDREVVNEVGPLFHGVNFCAFWNNTGDSENTLRALKQMGAKLIRFPGGTTCQWYDWENPYPKDWKDNWRDSAAWNMAKSVSGALMLQTNTARTDAHSGCDNRGSHQAGWVTYAKERGYQVGWWEIGNEPEMDAPGEVKQSSATVLAWYNARYEDQARAIRALDPKARLLGYSGTNVWQWWAERGLERFLAAHGNKQGTGLVDGISLHWYTGAGEGKWETVRKHAQGWYGCMEYIRAAMQFYDTRELPIHITEWNFSGDMGGMGIQIYQSALGNADMIGMMLKTGVQGQQYFCLHGPASAGWGALNMKGSPRGDAGPHPTYYGLSLASKLWGKVLETQANVDEGNVLSAYAAQDDSNTLQVMLINKETKPAYVTISFDAYKPTAREALLYRLESATNNPRDLEVVYNGVKDPQPQLKELPPPEKITCGPTVRVLLKPISMAVLSFPNAEAVTARAKPIRISAETMSRLKIGEAKAAEFKKRDPNTPAVGVGYLSNPPALGSDSSAWSAIKPLPLPFMKKDNGAMKLAWSEDGLHGLLTVKTGTIAVNPDAPWTADSVEVFIEKDGAGNWDRNVASAQYAFSPNPARGSGPGLLKICYGTPADKAAPPTCSWRKTDDGYQLEFLLPAAGLQPAKLDAGCKLGFNFALNVAGKPVEQFFSDKNNNGGWSNPASWGVIKLER